MNSTSHFDDDVQWRKYKLESQERNEKKHVNFVKYQQLKEIIFTW